MNRKVLLAAALASAVLYIFGAVALGERPTASTSAADVASFFATNAHGVKWFVWSGTLGLPALAYMLAVLCRLMPAPHREIFLIGSITLVVTTSVQSWIWGGLALRSGQLEPATARAILDVAMLWGPVLTGATITMMLPVTHLALQRDPLFPRWLGWLGAVVIVEQAIETVTVFGTTGFIEAGGAMNMELGAGMFLVWLFAFVLWAANRAAPAHAPRSAPEAMR